MPLVFEPKEYTFTFDNGLIVRVENIVEYPQIPQTCCFKVNKVIAGEEDAEFDMVCATGYFVIGVVDECNIKFSIRTEFHMYNRESKYLKPVMEITLPRVDCETALLTLQKYIVERLRRADADEAAGL